MMEEVENLALQNEVIYYALHAAKSKGLNKLETLVFVINALHDIYTEQQKLLFRYVNEVGMIRE